MVRDPLTPFWQLEYREVKGACGPLTCSYPTRCLGATRYAPDSSAARLRVVENAFVW